MTKINKNETTKQFTAMLYPSQIEEIKRYADLVGVKPSLMAKNLIDMALDDVKLLEKSGLLSTCLLGKKVFNRLKKKLFKEEEIELEDIIK